MKFIFFVIAILACLLVVYQGIVLIFYGWPGQGLTQMESRLIGIGLIAVALAAAYFLSSRRT